MLKEGDRVIAFYEGIIEVAKDTPVIKVYTEDSFTSGQYVVNPALKYIYAPMGDSDSFVSYINNQIEKNPYHSGKDILSWINGWYVVTSGWETVNDVAAYWNISNDTVLRAVKQGFYKNYVYSTDGKIRIEPEEAFSSKPTLRKPSKTKLIG